MTTFANNSQLVSALYVGYFGRAGDPVGVSYWIGQLNSGAISISNLAASFATQSEARTKYPYLNAPNVSNPTEFINQVYQNLFNRLPDAAGLAYWSAQLTAAGGNPTAVGNFILNVMSGATGTDNTTLLNKNDVALDFTTKASNAGTTWNATTQAQSATEITATTSDPASVTAQKAATDAFIASAPGVQLNFTLGVDNLTTSASKADFNAPLIFNPGTGAQIQSLQTGDSAVDTGTLGTLTVTLNAAGAGANGVVPGVTVTGIPTATITNIGAAASGFAGTITGLTTLTNLNSTAGVTAGLVGKGLNTALQTVNVNGTAIAGANTQAIIAAAALSGATDAVAVNFTGATGNAGAGVGAAQVVLYNDGATGTAATPNNAYETETISATAATFAQLSNAASGVLSTTTLNLKGAGAMQLSAAAGGDFANLTKIDASGATGGVVITGATNISAGGVAFNAGAAGLLTGNTKLTSFTGGTGADRLDISSMTTGAQLAAFTTLTGGDGRDTLVLSAGLMNTTTSLVNTGFEIVGSAAGLTGTVDFSKLGTGVDTIQLLGASGGATTINNAATAMTLDLSRFAGGSAFTVNGPAAAGDVLNILANNTGAGGTLGALTTTAFETVNATFSGGTANTIASITSTPTAGSLVTFNLIDNQTGGVGLTVTGATNVGGGTVNISGSETGTVTLTGDVTAGALSGAGLTASAGLIMGGKATAAINITGSGGADTLTGSAGVDTISGGAGVDIIANMATGVGGVGVGDTLTGGAGNDQFILRGDQASGAITAGYYSGAAVVTDMTVNPASTATDFISLSATAANYAVNIGAGGLQAAATAQGAVTIQSVSSASGANAILNAANEIVKLTSGVVTTGLTLQTAFNAAIGSTTITGATATGSYFFSMYDITNSKMVLGIVDATNGTNTVIQSGDTVALVGSVNMSASDYANINTNHFSILAA